MFIRLETVHWCVTNKSLSINGTTVFSLKPFYKCALSSTSFSRAFPKHKHYQSKHDGCCNYSICAAQWQPKLKIERHVKIKCANSGSLLLLMHISHWRWASQLKPSVMKTRLYLLWAQITSLFSDWDGDWIVIIHKNCLVIVELKH